MKLLKLFLLVLATATTSAYAACPDVPEGFVQGYPQSGTEQSMSSEEILWVHYKTDPELMPVGELFVMDIIVCLGNEPWLGTLDVDASMPAHGHGMNYKPEVRSEQAGHFFAQGFLFQMPGRWRFEFNLNSETTSQYIYSFVDI